MPKNIVIFSDGTGQEGGEGHNTNIYKLFNMIEDRTSRQIAFYDPGLGTGWRKITGNISGKGISRNIQQCYEFIFEHFESSEKPCDSDRIFLFGFSRGAATVRSLSSFIHYFGILPKSRPELISRAYKIYKKYKGEELKQQANAFVNNHHTMWTRIKFIGCFDTVAALGLPFKTASAILDGIPGFRSSFHNFRLSESIENAYHALAIDDERKTFHPVLWETSLKSYQTMQQVWFCGMHTDAGGGYEDQQLADIPLVWMTQKAVEKGLLIYPKHKVNINEKADGLMHNSRKKGFAKLYRHKIRSWEKNRQDKPVVHQSVLERKKNTANQNNPPYHPWILDLDYIQEPWDSYQKQGWYVE